MSRAEHSLLAVFIRLAVNACRVCICTTSFLGTGSQDAKEGGAEDYENERGNINRVLTPGK